MPTDGHYKRHSISAFMKFSHIIISYSAQKMNVMVDALVLASFDSHILQVFHHRIICNIYCLTNAISLFFCCKLTASMFPNRRNLHEARRQRGLTAAADHSFLSGRQHAGPPCHPTTGLHAFSSLCYTWTLS